jgi:hypothetical protein
MRLFAQTLTVVLTSVGAGVIAIAFTAPRGAGLVVAGRAVDAASCRAVGVGCLAAGLVLLGFLLVGRRRAV